MSSRPNLSDPGHRLWVMLCLAPGGYTLDDLAEVFQDLGMEREASRDAVKVLTQAKTMDSPVEEATQTQDPAQCNTHWFPQEVLEEDLDTVKEGG